MLVQFVFILVDEDDLETVNTELSDVTDVEELGLALGIRMSALEKIVLDYPRVDKQKRKVIYYWLTRKEIGRQRRGESPTWNVIVSAVAKFNPALSERIRRKYC